MRCVITASERDIWRKSVIRRKTNFNKANGSSEQTNRRVQLVDQEEVDDENIMILNVEGDENTKPYHMEGFIRETGSKQ